MGWLIVIVGGGGIVGAGGIVGGASGIIATTRRQGPTFRATLVNGLARKVGRSRCLP